MMLTKILASLCVGGLLVSCGPLNDESLGAGFSALVKARQAGIASAAPVVEQVTLEQIAANRGKFILVTVPSTNVTLAMIQGGQNGRRSTWLSNNSMSATFENGILVATRGFPRDLMAADVSGVRAAIAAGGGNAQRIHEFLGDLDQITTEVLQCGIALHGNEAIEILGQSTNVRRYDETCLGETLGFTNIYWVTGNGAIVRSQQAVSAEVGFVRIDVL